MGDVNQVYFAGLQNAFDRKFGRVLEVGSKDHGNTMPWRTYIEHGEWVGIDLEAGKGVDHVVNIEEGYGPLEPESFDLVIACSVLEHTPRPWILAERIQGLVRPGGEAYIATPWVQRYHAYPDDYYRFTHSAYKFLFPKFEWVDMLLSSFSKGEFFRVGMDSEMGIKYQERKYLPCLQLHGWAKRVA